jgi:hypothetical protein
MRVEQLVEFMIPGDHGASEARNEQESCDGEAEPAMDERQGGTHALGPEIETEQRQRDHPADREATSQIIAAAFHLLAAQPYSILNFLNSEVGTRLRQCSTNSDRTVFV